MRIEPGPSPLVILSTGALQPPLAPKHSFGALLRHPEPLSANEAQALLSSAWAAVVGKPPSKGTAVLLTAHWALETDAGRSMPGHNFAGIKASPGAPGEVFDTVEGHGASQRPVRARFRVYDSPEAGARDYVRLLATHYPAALEAAQRGDTDDFARALASGGYFTADPAAYSSGLRHRRESLDKLAFSGGVAAPAASVEGLASVALAGVLHAFRGASDDS